MISDEFEGKEEHLARWPEYVTSTFEQLGYEDYAENIESFVKRWGGLDRDTLVRVLKEGQGEDIVLAIFAVGSTSSPWACQLLLPFLNSSQSMERWASALCLGQMKEEQALPVLFSLLTECLPPKEWPTFQGDGLWLYNGWRQQSILLLAQWVRPEVVPALLEALQQVPIENRAIWNNKTRGDFIKEWIDRGFPIPEGGCENIDINHILPIEYGDTNNFWNLVPLDKEFHQQEVTPWWNAFIP